MRDYPSTQAKTGSLVLSILVTALFLGCDHSPAIPKLDEQGVSALVQTNSGVILIEFGAKWCGACRRLAPKLEALAQAYGQDVFFGQVDVDHDAPLATAHKVHSLPCMIVLKGGHEVDRLNGNVDCEEITRTLDRHLAAR